MTGSTVSVGHCATQGLNWIDILAHSPHARETGLCAKMHSWHRPIEACAFTFTTASNLENVPLLHLKSASRGTFVCQFYSLCVLLSPFTPSITLHIIPPSSAFLSAKQTISVSVCSFQFLFNTQTHKHTPVRTIKSRKNVGVLDKTFAVFYR